MGGLGESRRVFVLGAGASRHIGYPLTKDLGPKLMDWAEKNCPPNVLYWPERERLTEFGSLDDIEELVSRVEQQEKPGPILAGLREALCLYFDSIRVNEGSLYRQLAEDTVEAGDVIISFNYDVSLERELLRAKKWQIGDGYGFNLGINDLPASPIKLLKLHGSTSWTDSLFGGSLSFGFIDPVFGSRGSRPVILPPEFRFLGYPQNIKDPNFNGGGADRAGSMILPSRKKIFSVNTSIGRERETFWSSLWEQAAEALRKAEEVVIIGYSLPQADERAQTLLFDNIRDGHSPLTICCGSDSNNIGERFVEAGISKDRILLNWDTFENWIDAKAAAYSPV